MIPRYKDIYEQAKKYGLGPYEFDCKVLEAEKSLDGYARDVFNRIKSGENRGRNIGLNHEIYREACENLLLSFNEMSLEKKRKRK